MWMMMLPLQRARQNVPVWLFPEGLVAVPKCMNIRKKSKRPLTPPPHFRKLILQLVSKNSSILVPPPWVRSPDPTIPSWSLLALGRLLPSDDDWVDIDDDVGLATSQASRISGLCLLWICMDHVARPSFGAFKIMMIMKILMTIMMIIVMVVMKMVSTLMIILTPTQLG